MKNRRRIIQLAIVLFFVAASFKLAGQGKGYTMSEFENEQVIAFTDRDVYFNNDIVCFYASLVKSPHHGVKTLSKVLYVEVISANGTVVYQAKHRLVDKIATGTIELPDEVFTGNYLISFYTKWMRNFSSGSFTYKPIFVINPEKSATLMEGSDSANTKFSTAEIGAEAPFNLELAKDTFNIGENIEVNLSLKKGDTLPGNFTISVVPKALLFNSNKVFYSNYQKKTKQLLIPETRGISISGHIKSSNNLHAGAKVNITVFGKNNYSQSTLVDATGRFCFALPDYQGTRSVFTSAWSANTNDLSLYIDNDFCTDYTLPYWKHTFDSIQQKDIQRALYIHQINRQFNIRSMPDHDSLSTLSNYYSTPTFRLKLDEFIDLPTLEDYFHELVPQAGIRTSAEGKRRIQVYGESSDLTIYQPLVLLDGIIIDDIESLLSISPDNIQQIEVFNKPYIKGDNMYGGVIKVKSESNNFAGIDIGPTGMFLKFKFYNSFDNVVMPNYQSNSQLSNTLFWSTLSFTSSQKSFAFSTGNNYGEFEIRVSGFYNGKLIITNKNIMIKK